METHTSIITAMSPGYDDLKPPKVKTPGCEYLCYSERPLGVKGWDYRPLGRFPGQDAWFAPKHVKMFPWRYCGSQRSVWVDASIEIIGNLAELLDRHLGLGELGAFRHMSRNCAYREAQACIEHSKDSPKVIKEQMDRYRSRGFPQNQGLICGGVLLRRHTDLIQRLGTAWWHEVINQSFRDQLSFNYVCWRMGVRYVTLPGQLYGKNSCFKVHPQHKAQAQPA